MRLSVGASERCVRKYISEARHRDNCASGIHTSGKVRHTVSLVEHLVLAEEIPSSSLGGPDFGVRAPIDSIYVPSLIAQSTGLLIRGISV